MDHAPETGRSQNEVSEDVHVPGVPAAVFVVPPAFEENHRDKGCQLCLINVCLLEQFYHFNPYI
jgi:hypothetical protein